MWWIWPGAIWRLCGTLIVTPVQSNLGTGHGYSVLEIVKASKTANGVSVPYQIDPRRDGDIAACYADTEKATRVLGWRAEHSLVDMCRDAWRWQQNYLRMQQS